MSIPFTPLVASLPASTPFIGPETLERSNGTRFKARIGANESAFGISSKAADAIRNALQEPGQSWYADPENHDLRAALAEKHGVEPDEICVDGGIDSLLGLTVRMFVTPGTTVVTSNGAYPTFNYHVNGFGGTLETVPYIDNHEDPESLITAARELKARLIYIANPDNPMGTWHGSSVIAGMIDNLPEQSILLLDEAYVDFTEGDIAPPIQTDDPRVMRFRTFSKAYGMAGMRVGYVLAHRDLITGLNKIRNHFAINRLSQLAAHAALQDDAFLQSVQLQVEQGRQRIYQLANDMKLPYLTSATNFVAVDLGDSDLATDLLGKLNKAGIFMRMPGVPPLNQYIRVGVGTEQEHACFAEIFGSLFQETTS